MYHDPNLSVHHMMRILREISKKNIWYFSLHTAALFANRKADAGLIRDLQYYIDADMIEYIGDDLYGFRIPAMIPWNAQEILANVLRSPAVSYISFEYMLNQYGIISQIPTILTVATTGDNGIYQSRSYYIEFTHVDHTIDEILSQCTFSESRGIFVASPQLALKDLQNANRNLHLIDYDEYEEVINENIKSV